MALLINNNGKLVFTTGAEEDFHDIDDGDIVVDSKYTVSPSAICTMKYDIGIFMDRCDDKYCTKCDEVDSAINIMPIDGYKHAYCLIFDDYITIHDSNTIYHIDIKPDNHFKTKLQCNHIHVKYSKNATLTYISIYNNGTLYVYLENKLIYKSPVPADMKHFWSFKGLNMVYINQDDYKAIYEIETKLVIGLNDPVQYIGNFIVDNSHTVCYNGLVFTANGPIYDMVRIVGYILFEDKNGDLWQVINGVLQIIDYNKYMMQPDDIAIKSARKYE